MCAKSGATLNERYVWALYCLSAWRGLQAQGNAPTKHGHKHGRSPVRKRLVLNGARVQQDERQRQHAGQHHAKKAVAKVLPRHPGLIVCGEGQEGGERGAWR